MYLLIDWGNSQLKYMLVDELELVTGNSVTLQVEVADCIESLIERLSKHKNLKQALLASVRSDDETGKLSQQLQQAGLLVFVAKTSANSLGVSCAYQDPKNLGVDRWLAVLAAFNGECSIIVIDIGSAITLDLVNAAGEHLGGHIVPGQRLLRHSLLNTGQVKAKDRIDRKGHFRLGKNTSECVDYGIEQMIAGYLSQAINSASEAYEVERWIFTGGGGLAWFTSLSGENGTLVGKQAYFEPNLIFIGLTKAFQETLQGSA